MGTDGLKSHLERKDYTMIAQFQGIYRFLSNFWYVDIVYCSVLYRTVEHFYQAMKTLVHAERIAISQARTPGIAKKMASPNGYVMPDGTLFKISLRPDWKNIMNDVMLFGLRKKYTCPDLAQKLIDTYPHHIQEGNYWGDEYWGVNLRTGVGENHLGDLSEVVRILLINGVPLIEGPEPIF